MKNFYAVLLCIVFLIGCKNGVPPLTKSQLTPPSKVYAAQLVKTNIQQKEFIFVNPAKTGDFVATIKVPIFETSTNSTNKKEDYKTAEVPIKLTITEPSQTNSITVNSAHLQKAPTSQFLSGAFLLLWFGTIGIIFGIWYKFKYLPKQKPAAEDESTSGNI